MKYTKIVLAGGNGYLGNILANYYKDLAEEVVILSRKVKDGTDQVGANANIGKANTGIISTVLWDGKTEGLWTDEISGADLLINLCGKNVNCRYNEKNRKEIIASRTIPTRLLNKVISQMEQPPKVWINVTSATIYRHAEDHPQDEQNGEIGYGFSIDVCKQWEASFFETETPSTRKIALRMGIVLGRHESVFPRLLNLVKFGLGGRQGDGNQYVSWIHEHDAARTTEWLLEHTEIDGIVNCTAPGPVKNAELMYLIRKAYGMPIGLPSPQWLLEIGMWLIGSETELVLKSRWVVPKRLLTSGFSFQFEKAEHAVHDILSIRV